MDNFIEHIIDDIGVSPDRVSKLNRREPALDEATSTRYVLYWMQASQRTTANHALEYAAALANHFGLPLLVCFGVDEGYPEANIRHYTFMLEGLEDVRKGLEERGAGFVLMKGGPWHMALRLSKGAAAVVTDRGYLRHQIEWRDNLAAEAAVPVYQVETDAVVPVNSVSTKQEFAARTIRPKLHNLKAEYSDLPGRVTLKRRFDGSSIRGDSNRGLDPAALLDPAKVPANPSLYLSVDESVGTVSRFLRGGEKEAERKLDEFISSKLKDYHKLRNDPGTQIQSGLSHYLHFGQISPLYIAKKVEESAGESGAIMREKMDSQKAEIPKEAADAFIEELFVRRELSLNYVTYNNSYDRYIGLPSWALDTLHDHADDKRPKVYTREQLEAAETHDKYWNAATREMLVTGSLHNYMRMYWGKKILEWSESPEDAFYTLLSLNNKYCVDGRDPNSYVGVGWCFGLHDRPWKEREIFGKVRYMNDRGLERKFDMSRYLGRIEELAGPL